MFTSEATQPTPSGQESPGHVDLDYSSDKCEAGPDNALGDEEDKDYKSDNRFLSSQGDKTAAPQEIIIAAKKPVLTQQGIMDLIENQASSKRTVANAGWDKRKQEYSQMLDGYESPTSRTVQVDVGLATLMIISAVTENANKINLAAQQSQISVCLIVSRVRAYLTTDQHQH